MIRARAAYGVDTGKFIFNKIDHCQYVAPIDVVTPCHVVRGNASVCVDKLSTDKYNKGPRPPLPPRALHRKHYIIRTLCIESTT